MSHYCNPSHRVLLKKVIRQVLEEHQVSFPSPVTLSPYLIWSPAIDTYILIQDKMNPKAFIDEIKQYREFYPWSHVVVVGSNFDIESFFQEHLMIMGLLDLDLLNDPDTFYKEAYETINHIANIHMGIGKDSIAAE